MWPWSCTPPLLQECQDNLPVSGELTLLAPRLSAHTEFGQLIQSCPEMKCGNEHIIGVGLCKPRCQAQQELAYASLWEHFLLLGSTLAAPGQQRDQDTTQTQASLWPFHTINPRAHLPAFWGHEVFPVHLQDTSLQMHKCCTHLHLHFLIFV